MTFKIQKLEVAIHFASIGELNSIKFITDNLLNKKFFILLYFVIL